ncbi:potassium transport protein TRK1/TRK2 [Polychaeton citri CBS 116435]|uniref:Potassium transport protein n=1 Tax=Polychaeton citri CBS 116435 TaxID=1314669 RepID=A0A9P4QGK1_9PEZI|nr:potassium transport protein TRK1/TRK2 [Polychaeton citri CBS 116435]
MAIYGPLLEIGQWFYDLIPRQLRFRRPSFSFIMVHYMYMIGMSLVGSIMLYPAGLMPYIDALFFSSGAATQSGLNTIDINLIHTYQQVVLYFMAMICNPVFINTMVVLVRLHWFEKRFDAVVKEANDKRKNKSFSKSRTIAEESPRNLENGVQGREIKVLHETTKPNGLSGSVANPDQVQRAMEKLDINPLENSVEPTPEGSNQSTATNSASGDEIEVMHNEKARETSDEGPNHLGLHPSLHRDIIFADQRHPREDEHEPQTPETPQSSDSDQPARQKDVSHHITFLERQQRNARQGGGTLRIPGPRDFERGEKPKQLDEDDDNELKRSQTRNTLTTIRSSTSDRDPNRAATRTSTKSEELNADDHPFKKSRGITIDEPEHPRHTRRPSEAGAAANADSTPEELHEHGRVHNLIRGVTNPLHIHRRQDTQTIFGRALSNISTARTMDKHMQDPMPYLSWQPTIGRNSAFVGLTEEQREELGGIEYRALKLLRNILCWYFIGFHVSGVVILLPWIILTRRWKDVVLGDGVNPSWWGIFTSASMFNDLGFTLTPDSMISFSTAALPLLYGSFLIIIGNTGFPCMLRFIIWLVSKFTRKGTAMWEELRFLLDHPRRCFTLLFPSKATWWLFWVLVALNGIDLIFFIILDLHDSTVTSLPTGYRVIGGWFQAASTRTAGFSVVNLADLHPAIQVSYLIMMYISVFPIAISVRRTNVYEEKSLGVYGDNDAPGEDEPSYVGQHLRRQLSFDLWYVFLGFFVIAIVEGPRLADNGKYAFNMFSVLFEIVSAYGTVGLSLGYPGKNASFSTEFAVLSKLVIIAMQIRGRHRGLPYALDRAILLPSESLHKKEAEDALVRHNTMTKRRNSMFSESDLRGDADLPMHSADTQATATGNAMMTSPGGADDLHTGVTLQRHTTGVSTSAAEPTRLRHHMRRGSGLSTQSATPDMKRHPHTRGRSFSKLVVSGLSAGPTLAKHENA